ncbi:MAG: DMT family transporter [Bacteroidales bacterium]|jgi:drug/metabolite transporter (DMT)-like permease|nr:DMT family transporter [Bacteroidales bacterium]NPV35600.1 DMT family transporter [Bacteroidales bacterium]
MPWGEIAALLTAFLWTGTALAFEIASKRLGSLTVNLLRLSLAFIYLLIFNYFYRGLPLPTDAGVHSWFWLLLSGVAGFVFGDFFLFSAFRLMGARTTMLIQTLVPPITAFIGFFVLGEVMSWMHLAGMMLTMSGIALVVVNRGNGNGRPGLNFPVRGLVYALAGAVGQATGLVLSKYGMGSYSPFAATQIRIIAGIIGFFVIVVLKSHWSEIRIGIKDRKGMRALVLGSILGPFLGVSFSLLAIQKTQAGIASTLMGLTPVLILAPSALLFKQKVTLREWIGAAVSVMGASLFFL